MRRSGRRVLAVLPPVLVALGLAPVVAAADAASPVQREILGLFFTILIFALIIGVLVHILLLAAVQWYKDSPRWRPPKGHPRTHDRRIEVGWTIGPALILAGVVIITLFALQTIERPSRYDYALDVIGAQWAWRFRYPDYTLPNATTVSVPDSSGTMYIQQDLVFLLRVHSEDVIHAFYVPDLGIKIDVVPGTTNIFWVQATIPGTYTVQCAEFCGVGHSQMHGEVVVFPPGTQTIPYGPPPSAVQPGFGTAKYTIVDVAFKEHPGPCLPGSQWSLEPCRISLGSNFNVTFRVWNNESGTHQFELGSPISLVGPIQDTSTAAQPAYFNFNTGNPGQYSFWCNISGHRGLGMEGSINVTGPVNANVIITDTSVTPPQIEASLGTTLILSIQNNGASGHTFSIGPPYGNTTGPIAPSATAGLTVVLNRTTDSAGIPYGDLGAGVTGTLRVVAVGRGPPPPPPPPGFPVVEVTFGLAGLAAAAAIAFNFKLARAARRRRQFPPEED